MTVAVLRGAGVSVDDSRPDHWIVAPGSIRAFDHRIEQDLSNAGPFLAAALATRGTVRIPDWPADTPAPDQERALVLYKYDACPYCQMVQRVVDDLGVPVQMADTRKDPKNRADLKEKTGRTQVPCLFIDGHPLFESGDISAWLTAYSGRDAPST